MVSSLQSLNSKKYLSLIGYIIFGGLFICLSVLLFWKCKFGYAFADESSYLSMSYRFLQGDLFFKDEHCLTQASVFPILPVFRFVLSLNGSTDGIVLAMRYCYTVVKILIAFLIFFSMKKVSFIGASVSSLCFLVYSPFNIEQLSYNSLGQIGLIVSMIFLYTPFKKYVIIQWLLSGLFFAVSVLCCPPLILMYFVWTILTFILKYKKYDIFNPKKWLFFTLSASMLALIFCIYLFSKITLDDILSTIQFVMADPSHSFTSFNPFSYFKELWNSCSVVSNGSLIPITKICYVLYIFLFVLLLRNKAKKVSLKHSFPIFIILEITSISHLLASYLSRDWNTVIFPLNITALFIYLLTKKDVICKIFYYFWLPGMIYSFIINYTSNTGYTSLSSASSVALIGSVLMIVLYVKEETVSANIGTKCIFYICTFALLLTQILSEGILHFDNIYADYSLSSGDLSCKINEGSLKGIVTCAFLYDGYQNVQNDLNVINEDPTIQSVLYVYGFDWYYLNTPQKRNASPISFFLMKAKRLPWLRNLLQNYYSENPNKRPDYIFVGNLQGANECESAIEWFKILFPNYSLEKTSCGLALRK